MAFFLRLQFLFSFSKYGCYQEVDSLGLAYTDSKLTEFFFFLYQFLSEYYHALTIDLILIFPFLAESVSIFQHLAVLFF